MPTVACLAVAGIELWFNSNDHLPPHFHAEKSCDWEVRVFFLREPKDMFEVVYCRLSKPFPPEAASFSKPFPPGLKVSQNLSPLA